MTTTGITPRVIVAQLGARRHYLVPRSLLQQGHLEHFYTDVYFGRRPHIDPLVATCLGIKGAAFRRRSEPSIPISMVADFPYLSLGAMAHRGSPCRRWMATGKQFASSVVRKGLGEADTVIAYSSAALEIFELARTRGVVTILDHATAPRDLEMSAVAREEERFPGWAAEPALDDPALASYVERQQLERNLADRILCGSSFVAAALASGGRSDPSKLRVVPLGVAPPLQASERRARAGRDDLRVLFVGSEGLRKGLGYLLEALARLNSDRIRLRVACDPGFSAIGMSEVHKRCEACRVVPRHELREWYEWADVLVLPSISDTFGIVILEAMAAGLPVIASQASGGPDLIRDGIDGWIVPIRDSDAIAAKLEYLATSNGVAREMGAGARTRATAFDVDAYRVRLLDAIAS